MVVVYKCLVSLQLAVMQQIITWREKRENKQVHDLKRMETTFSKKYIYQTLHVLVQKCQLPLQQFSTYATMMQQSIVCPLIKLY